MNLVNRALMKYYPDFFTLSEEDQMRFRMGKAYDSENEDNDKFRDDIVRQIRDFISNEVAGIPEPDDRKDGFTEEQLLKFNEQMTYFYGIGPQPFYFNELDWCEDILRFENLYDYNKDYHEFQENARAEHASDNNYEKTPLHSWLAFWSRAIVDGEFHYININSYAYWVSSELEEIWYQWQDEHIPSDFVENPDHGKRDPDNPEYTQWSMCRDAGGKEAWLKAMTDFYYDYATKVNDECNLVELDEIYVLNTPMNEGDPDLTYVFAGMEILKNITFTNFINDCKPFIGDTHSLNMLVEAEKVDFKLALDKEFDRVQKEVPLNVVVERDVNKIYVPDDIDLD